MTMFAHQIPGLGAILFEAMAMSKKVTPDGMFFFSRCVTCGAPKSTSRSRFTKEFFDVYSKNTPLHLGFFTLQEVCPWQAVAEDILISFKMSVINPLLWHGQKGSNRKAGITRHIGDPCLVPCERLQVINIPPDAIF